MKETDQDMNNLIDLKPVPTYHKVLMGIATVMMFVLLYLIFVYSSVEKVIDRFRKSFTSM